MENIKMISHGIYLPENRVENKELVDKYNVTEEYIYKRTGIKTRYYIKNETIEDMAICATSNLLEKSKFDKNKIGMIITATTSSNRLMPSISYLVQKSLNIQECMCLDILAGCSGYINAFDIARNYIALGKVEYALIIGVDVLSEYTDKEDMNTSIILSDGAGATLIGKSIYDKHYSSYIQSNGQNGDILVCNSNEKIAMDGVAIYKYAVTDTVKNIEKLLEETNLTLEDIKYIIPHQSNLKIIKGIASRLNIETQKIYVNIENVGNTFCASIPIAISEMFDKNLIQEKDKILMIGYGGGLNTGSIILEV